MYIHIYYTYIYTHTHVYKQVYKQDSRFYKELNKRLRPRESKSLKPFFPYLNLVVTGLHRLAPSGGGRGATSTAVVLNTTYSSGQSVIARSLASRCTPCQHPAGTVPLETKMSASSSPAPLSMSNHTSLSAVASR